MTITKVNVKKFNKKFIVTALGVAALGFQLMQTNDVKADDTADSKTGDAADEQSNMQTKSSSVADSSSIQSNSSSNQSQNDTDTTDNTQQSTNNNNQEQAGTDTSNINQNNSNQTQNSTDATNDVQNSNDDNSEQQANTNSNNQDSNTNGIQAASANVTTTSNNDASSNDSTNDGSNPETDTENNTASGEETDTDATTNQNSQNDVAASSNIMIQNPAANRVPNDYKDPVKANVSMTATTDEGSITSENTDEDKNASVVVNKDAQTTLNFTIATGDESANEYNGIFELPAYNDTATNKTPIVVDDSFDPSTMITGVPDGALVTYLTDKGYETLEELKNDSDFEMSDLKAIKIDSNWETLGPNQEIKITVPLKNTDTSEHQLNTINPTIEVDSYTVSYFRTQSLNATYKNMDDSIKQSDLTGQYPAVTVNDLGVSYTAADKEIQDKMPTYTGGSDIQVNNFTPSNKDELTDADKSDWTYGSHAYVNLVSSGITQIANTDGYSVLLNADGSQQTQYDYDNIGNGVTIMANPNNSGDDSSTNTIKGIYISLRHVIDAQDSTATVGQDWSAADNLTSVQDNDDNVLTGDDAINAVTTSIDDPDSVLSDGKVTKAGSFDVTYTYNLKDGTAITKTVTVTVDPVNSGSSSSSSTSNTGSNTSSTTDPTEPVISPDSPDNINDQVRLVSTNPDDGIVSLYKLDTTEITNRRLGTATDWYSDKDMSFAGDTYYRVATNEWVKASNVYVYENNKVVVQTKNNQQLVDSKGNVVTNRSLIADSDWYSDRIAQINGKDYYRVATNEFVPVDAVTVL
ncbi:SLAP domain-containing protein [Companilactobacillus halodurans]|uniref:S-layer protein C-terminal domain-containing protein n=1 Tax=Companilactobacillus halodurans TaxID=2584183 RepID=A0A5P0ZS95_9LACO|nr:SLAP domain-containing protein [Companilactobacillus halodurans]MQS76945.1 hypothetical protein [Companilactobacillus halodurans]MQS98525.1 hypothetical protein [Companilactobacillus halodurans]